MGYRLKLLPGVVQGFLLLYNSLTRLSKLAATRSPETLNAGPTSPKPPTRKTNFKTETLKPKNLTGLLPEAPEQGLSFAGEGSCRMHDPACSAAETSLSAEKPGPFGKPCEKRIKDRTVEVVIKG